MWCQTICGLFYENKSESKHDSEIRIAQDFDETSQDAEEKMSKSNDKMDQDGNESDSSDETTPETTNKNDARLLEQVISKLKSRFKARIILQETLITLSNYNNKK